MEQFSIACTTCQAKLRVRDASAIGQIVTCPKCGSMVLIEAPSSPSDADAKTSAPVPNTAKPPPRPGAVSTGQHAPHPNTPAEKTAGEADPTFEEFSEPAVVKPEHSPETVAADTASNQMAAETAAAADSTAATIAPPDSRFGRRWILAALAGTTGALMAVTLFVVYAIATAKNAPPPEIAKATPGTGDSTPIAVPPTVTSTPQSKSEEPPPPEVSAPVPPAVDTQPKSDEVVKPAPMPPSPSVEELPAKPEAAPPTANAVLPNAPPGFTPADDDTSKADKLSGTESLSETLRKLGGLVDEPEPDMEKPEEGPNSVAPVAPVPDVPAKEEPTRLVRPAQRTIDVQARLSDPIPEIEFNKIPLNQLLQFVTDFSTIPVTLDPDVLIWLDLTPTTPVSTSQRDTNVAKLLTEVLSKLGLSYEIVDQHLVVSRRSANAEAKTKTKLNVEDLVTENPAYIHELKDHIQELIAPGTWNGDGQANSLTIDGAVLIVEQDDEALYQVIALCEKLRVARGLKTRGRFNPRIFELATRTQRAQVQLGKAVTLNYSRPTSFVKILQRMSGETGAHLLVDWRAVAEAGWNPDAEVTFTAVDQPLAKSLTMLLQPMELDYRIVDESTIQIVTPLELDERCDLEIYPIAKFEKVFADVSSAEVVMKQALALIPGEWLHTGGGRGAIRYDAPSQSLLVSLPQRQQQQFEERLKAVAPAGEPAR